MDYLGKANEFVTRIHEEYGIYVTYTMNSESIRLYWRKGKKKKDHRCQYLGDEELLESVFGKVEREIQEWIKSR